jgi:rubredoxin
MKGKCMFTICPECSNNKIKVKTMEKRMYDPSTARTTVNEEIDMVEYHCNACGWTVLLEDPPFVTDERAKEQEALRSARATGV